MRWQPLLFPLPPCGESARVKGIRDINGELLMRGPDKPKTPRARSLRKVENDAEEKLRSELRARRLNGLNSYANCLSVLILRISPAETFVWALKLMAASMQEVSEIRQEIAT